MSQESINQSQKISTFQDYFEIIPCNSFNKTLSNYSSHITYSVKVLLIELLEQNILEIAKKASHSKQSTHIEHFLNKFEALLPLSKSSISYDAIESNVSLTTICSAHNTQGAGRHIADICSHWLVPGKQIPLTYVFSFVFSFNFAPEKRYLVHQINANILDVADVATVEKTLPIIDKEIKISIGAVQHARGIISKNCLDDEKKKQLIHQNIESLIKKPNTNSNESLFNHIHHLFVKLSSEQKTSRINEQIAPLLTAKSKIFKRDIFTDLQNFVLQFQNDFIFYRSISHLSRLVSNIYLFKKNMAQQIIGNPNQRHLHLKILNSEYDTKEHQPFVALLICVNILKPNEVIAKKQIEKALQATLFNPFHINFFESIDKTNHALRLLYFEIVKQNHLKFETKELQELKTQLAKSIKVHIKRTINPLFMAKNEEEILKNVITLSRQLKYVQDIPQIMINFHKQTENDLIFTVIILRIIKSDSYDMKEKLSQMAKPFSIENLMIKVVGYLRKKHQKQASVFDIRLCKKQFLQQDFSVDLYEPRTSIYYELSKQLGQLRDFNGGMIFKQHEVYAQLKQNVLNSSNADEFALKNFFYKITPSHMQGVIDPLVLEGAFSLLHQEAQIPTNTNYELLDCFIDSHYCLLCNTTCSTIKKEFHKLIHSLSTTPCLLASSSNSNLRIIQTIFLFKLKQGSQHILFRSQIDTHLNKLQISSESHKINELEMYNLKDKKSSYEIYHDTKEKPNLMLNEHL